ncbi:MAG: short-chain dehydrogenase [Flavobacteriales bacterium]|jgi:3-oxoacyl-[acyl-carrier protein] reductase|nr:short-chain dehydrogenase [Flavobacteriales bacterium]|tara:strand:+ start:24346 stop:25053 length:708 start_codon:yes stop_codon:yes gene_type:complete
MNLKNKKIIITGGSLGIGKETAKNLLNKGANVLLIGRSMNRLNNAFKNSNAHLFSFDIGDVDKIKLNAAKCLSALNYEVDVLINNAGIGVSKSIDELNYSDFLKVFNVNVFGLSLFTKEITPFMKKRKNGTIINIGSTASLKGYKNGSIYASSKFALRGLSQCWQAELRPYNIRVCQINPSEVTTAFGSNDRVERDNIYNKLSPKEISHSIISALEMSDKGFVNEVSVWATNPFE